MSEPLRLLLGVTGGIAAYKAAEVVRLAKGRGHSVRVALTRSAAAFVAPLTLEVLSGHEVYQEEYLAPSGRGEELHLSAARWAQVLGLVPATAHVLARVALGLADDFLTTTALAFSGPLVAAPAMHPDMWYKPAVQEHVARLRERGVRFVGPVDGPLASGEVGMGRMAEPADIVAAFEAAVAGGALRGRTVLVTAGPTHEPVDPVRFLGNRSSGRMGFALAAEAARRGARVVLVAGPVALATPPGVARIDVETAEEMARAVAQRAPAADLVIMAAAVADFRPSDPVREKIPKERGLEAIVLTPNPDILSRLAEVAPQALKVGFAAETGDPVARAREKLARKAVDFMVANDVSRPDIGFGSEANEVTILAREGPPVFLPRRPKTILAADLLDLFSEALEARETRAVETPG